jgi:hypothetical protein
MYLWQELIENPLALMWKCLGLSQKSDVCPRVVPEKIVSQKKGNTIIYTYDLFKDAGTWTVILT